jgi:hypothetical protein
MAPLAMFIAAGGAGLSACASCIALPFKMNERAKTTASKAFCRRKRMTGVEQNRERMSIGSFSVRRNDTSFAAAHCKPFTASKLLFGGASCTESRQPKFTQRL